MHLLPTSTPKKIASRPLSNTTTSDIMGSKSALLRTLVAASSVKMAGFGVPSSVPKWRARNDSNL